MFIYFWEKEKERETECEWGWGREIGRHRIRSRLQALSCQHSARHGAPTHKTLKSWPEPKLDVQLTEPPRSHGRSILGSWRYRGRTLLVAFQAHSLCSTFLKADSLGAQDRHLSLGGVSAGLQVNALYEPNPFPRTKWLWRNSKCGTVDYFHTLSSSNSD